jgi:hypothetical protein
LRPENAAAHAASQPGWQQQGSGIMRKRVATAAAAVAAVAGCAVASPLSAQGALLPEVRYLQPGVADATAPRLSVGILNTTLLVAPGPERPAIPQPPAAARDVQAAVAIGAVFPLLQLAEWTGGGALLIVDGRVFGRFRLGVPTRDDMGQDWYVGIGAESAHERWSGRLVVVHRSSHIGDEFAAATGAARIEFGGEHVELTAAHDVPGFGRLYGIGSWVFRSYLRWDPHLRSLGVNDRAVLQAGIDREWQPWSDPRFRIVGGIDVHAAQRTEWRRGHSTAIGAAITTRRSLRLLLRSYDGMSHMGEFFLTPERYVAIELSASF